LFKQSVFNNNGSYFPKVKFFTFQFSVLKFRNGLNIC